MTMLLDLLADFLATLGREGLALVGAGPECDQSFAGCGQAHRGADRVERLGRPAGQVAPCGFTEISNCLGVPACPRWPGGRGRAWRLYRDHELMAVPVGRQEKR